MDKEYVYEDEQETEGLTFKKIGRFLRKGWLRMVVYMIIAALAVTAIAVPVKVFAKSEPVAQTSVEYIYVGIEKGLDPNGKTLNTDDIIATTVLAKAVEQANLGKKIKDITTLRNAMRVEAVLTDEYVELTKAAANGDTAAADRLRNYNMFPTRFDIIISDPSELDLSDDQAKLLLNKIVTCYFAEFQDRYSIMPTFEGTSYDLSQNDELEFADIYDTYLESLQSVNAFLQEMTDSDVGFISTANNTTFAQLFSDLNVLSSSYNQFNAFILSNNIWRDKDTARDALLSTQTEILNRLEPLNGENGYIQSLKDQIASIKPTTTSTDAGGVHTDKTEYPKIYDTLHARLDEANRQVREYNIQLKNIDTRLENLKSETPTDAALITQAVAKLSDLETRTLALIEKVKTTVADYYDTTFVSASVRQVQPPVVTRKSIEFSLLVVYAVALIVALLAAGIVTGVKMSKSAENKAKAEPQPTEQEEETK